MTWAHRGCEVLILGRSDRKGFFGYVAILRLQLAPVGTTLVSSMYE